MKLIIFLILIFNATHLYAQESSLHAKLIVAHQSKNLIEERRILEQILSNPSEVAEFETFVKEWEHVMFEIIHSNINTPEAQLYVVKTGDTLGKIAKEFSTTVELIQKRNKLKGDTIIVGQKLSLWTAPFRVEVDKTTNRLKLFLNNKTLKTYAVSTGKSETTTPIGEFVIKDRYPNPIWFHRGVIVPAGSPENFLGTRWLGFNKEKYGIHGTIYPELIGQSVSGGCVRMKNRDVEELYDIIPIGTKVVIR